MAIYVRFVDGNGMRLEEAVSAKWSYDEIETQSASRQFVSLLVCLDGNGKRVAEFRDDQVAGFIMFKE